MAWHYKTQRVHIKIVASTHTYRIGTLDTLLYPLKP